MAVAAQRYAPKVKLASLLDHPQNPRRGEDPAVAESIDTNGWYGAIIAQWRTKFILAGHTRRRSLIAKGDTTAPVIWLDCDDETALRILLADNRTAELATWDNELLTTLLAGMDDLAGTGFTDAALADLMRGQPEDNGDPDVVPAVAKETITQPGDLWHLGEHRILCGDSTLGTDVKRLMDGYQAQCMWTDPPYGVSYTGKTKDALKIANDTELHLEELLPAFLGEAGVALVPGSPAYVASPPGPLSITFADAITQVGWLLRQQLVWIKDVFVMGHSDYHYRHEPIWMAYTPGGAGRRGRGGDSWYGDDSASSVFEIPRPKASQDHPTMKPVELITPMITNSCPPGGIVYEPFAGSGSTLIAAHEVGRRCYGLELDPVYTDVICRRWQAYSGVVPRREDGTEVNFELDDAA